MRPFFSKAMLDVQWALISLAASSLAHFLLRLVLGRELGADGLGIYTLAFTIYLLGMQFAAFGIGSALTKYVAEFLGDQFAVKRYVSSGMTASIITGTAMGVTLFLLAPSIANSFFHIPELQEPISYIALCFPFIAVQKAVLGTLNGYRRMRLFAFLNIAQNVTVVLVSILLAIWAGMGVMGAVLGFVLPTMVISALCPLLIRGSMGNAASFWNKAAMKATTLFGFYIVLQNSISFLNTQVDSILIGYFRGATDVGIYAVAFLFAETLTLIPSAVQKVTVPMTASMYGKGDVAGVRRLFFSALKKSFLVTLCLALVIAILAPMLITFLFKEGYLSGYPSLLILLVGYTMSSALIAVGATLSSIGKVRIPFRISALSGILNVILNVILTPIFGIEGAAAATTISMLVYSIITIVVVNSYLKGEALPSDV